MNVLRNLPIDQVSQLLLDAPDLSIPADLLTKVQQWRHHQNDDSESSSSSSSSSSDSDDFDNDAAGTAGKRKKRDHHQHQGNKSQLTELWQPTKR